MYSLEDIEVLIVTTDREDCISLYNQMNIKTDAIISNQNNKSNYSIEKKGNNTIRIISNCHKGVGKNRNTAISYADKPICILADDDMFYEDNYANMIAESFNRIPNADIIIFNIVTIGKKTRERKVIEQTKRVRKWNCLKYGAARIAFKLDRLNYANVHFSSLFGGGAKYSAGEDSLFIIDCLKKGLKIYAVPIEIAKIRQDSSSWFQGYTEKYFFDKGVLYKQISKYGCYFFCLFDIIRHYKKYQTELKPFQVYRLMMKGFKVKT